LSRIGKMPVHIPPGVELDVDDTAVVVKGPKGELAITIHHSLRVERDEKSLVVYRQNDEPEQRALHGLTRSLLNNMVIGVTQGFERILDLVGTGYRAEQQSKNLLLQLGFSHPVTVEPLGSNELVAASQTRVIVRGIDKQQVGEQAARIRKLRRPNPYTGKGIKYDGEEVKRKEGKSAVSAGS